MKFWSKIRRHNASYYITIPADYARTLLQDYGNVLGKDVKVKLEVKL